MSHNVSDDKNYQNANMQLVFSVDENFLVIKNFKCDNCFFSLVN